MGYIPAERERDFKIEFVVDWELDLGTEESKNKQTLNAEILTDIAVVAHCFSYLSAHVSPYIYKV